MAMIHDSEDPEGVKDDGSAELAHGPSDDLQRAKERKGIAAMEMFIRTRSWERAAEGAGYPTPRAARVAAEKALENEFKQSSRSQEFMRKYAAKHLDILMGSLAVKTADPSHPEHIAAIKTARELIAQQAKLLGLDAPTKLSLVDPTQEQIEEYLNDAIGPRHTDEEADIFETGDIVDAVVVEDDEVEVVRELEA
jgi:hypothetical protein